MTAKTKTHRPGHAAELGDALPAPPRHERKYMTEPELQRLVSVARGDFFDHALVTLMYNGALRASEVGMLTLDCAKHLHTRKLFVWRVKHSLSGWLDIHESAATAAIDWVQHRYPDKRARQPEDPLFPKRSWRGNRSGGISRFSVARAIRRLSGAAGLPADVAHPHALRHARVMHILEAVAEKPDFHFELLVPTLAKFLGHAAATTTITYYMHELKGVPAVEQGVLDRIFDAIDGDGPEAGPSEVDNDL